MDEKKKISLEILILNDFLRLEIIDKNIYDQAITKINSMQEKAA